MNSDAPHWFKDLLSLWRPSGHEGCEDGLRLAVRNGYLNFYRRGQSAARVSKRRGALRAEVHAKYVAPSEDPKPGQEYWSLRTDRVTSPGGPQVLYRGLASLHDWIALIDKKYAGVEKRLVDDLVGLNANVIDLEMGLPAWGEQLTAPRMDLVAIEEQQVVFWEAKTITDGRIRCRADYEQELRPEVLRQLAKYRHFLAHERHVELVEVAYRQAAAILVELRALADLCGDAFDLGDEIVSASKAANLTVAASAALVVLDEPDDAGRAWRSWKAGHEAKLAGRIPMLVQRSPGRLSYKAAL